MAFPMETIVARPGVSTDGMVTGTECVGASRRRLTATAMARNASGRRTIAAVNWTACCGMWNVNRMKIAAVDAVKWMISCADRLCRSLLTDDFVRFFLIV